MKYIHYFRPFYIPLAKWYYERFRAPKRYHHLYDIIKDTKATKILEIGVWNGKRAVKMIKTAQQQNGDTNIEYFGFDLFEDLSEDLYKEELSKRPPTKGEVEGLLKETGANIHLYAGNTMETLPREVGRLPQMDFIFIDGGHSNETVLNDWMYCKELMHKDTVLIFDDYWRNRTDGGSKKTVDTIDQEKYKVEILPEVDKFKNPDFGKLEISFAKVTKK